MLFITVFMVGYHVLAIYDNVFVIIVNMIFPYRFLGAQMSIMNMNWSYLTLVWLD